MNLITKLTSKLNLKSKVKKPSNEGSQDLELYWSPEMGNALETWGEKHVWNEIQMFLCSVKGRVLDIACGTGITSLKLQPYTNLDIYGCDISDFLINKAIDKGLDKKKYVVCDATNMKIYEDHFFDYSYSIGSLEHFTEEGIVKFISETFRITKKVTFHMLPVSRTNKNEGWMKTNQSFYNNSIEWWLAKFSKKFDKVEVIDSGWDDDISIGKWFVCYKQY